MPTDRNSVRQMIARVNASGSHWFERGAMAFFSTRVCGSTWTGHDGNEYFVTQESVYEGKRFTVRFVDSQCVVQNLSTPFQHLTYRAAKAEIAKHLKGKK